ncbi:DUF3347 domain-containing protein [Flavihumibacter fluvii]|uniref:DUF3347 domain-containing protein n=1 Tax=Flavihumibacter fluvii TaxID=2838157 RepID=UPI001BDE946B|nr:DUF3347 domain-containing protein [Flavihumibacter fluvii]ULQ50985.1 DUF3347 domain-containing protein [Flavihumibacter fluvii]
MKLFVIFAGLLLSVAGKQAHAADPLKAILAQYMVLKDALVDSDPVAAAAQAKVLLKSLEGPNWESLKKDTKAIADSKDIKKQREAFASLSDKLYALVKASKPGTTIYYQHCPMFNSGKGANWLSLQSEIRNPFYGDMMISCGSTAETIKQ